MQCNMCRNEAVFFQPASGRYLCDRHLVWDIEARAKRSIRSHHWMKTGDHIAVAVTGSRNSAALLLFLKKLTAARRDIRLSAVPPDGRGTGTEGPSVTVKIAESLRIPCIGTSHPGGTGNSARDPVTKIAIATSLDDIAQDVLGEFLFGNTERLGLPRPGEGTRIPEIYPFIAIPSGELDLYWEIEGPGIDLPRALPDHDPLRQETGVLLERYCRRHPATKYALLHLGEELREGNEAGITAAGTISRRDDQSRDGMRGTDE
jgi:tRNA(Ile)-lysidine synthase TilS/MesJ